MKIIEPSIEIIDDINGDEMLKRLEKAGRTCYKSEDKINEESDERFLAAILRRGHESVIEHEKITVKITCDRGISHQIVRHRIASYSQESTRYCNYSNDKFGSELSFIKPVFWDENNEEDKKQLELWKETLLLIEKNYLKMIEHGAKPDEARSILPNSLKTEIIVTMNLRSWRHFLKLRTDIASHPQIREIANMILNEFKKEIKIIFDDIKNT